MQSPIPDPFAPPNIPTVVKGPRPPHLIWIIGISWVLTLCSALWGHSLDYGFGVLIGTCLFGLCIDYFLWLGHNWARIVTIVFSVISFSALFGLDPRDAVAFVVDLIGALYGIVWIVYLTRPSVVAFFKGRPADSSGSLPAP